MDKENDTSRDYDIDPIVIIDYNILIDNIYYLAFVPFALYGYIYNPFGGNEGTLHRFIYVILPMMLYPYISPLLSSFGKRKVVLTNDKITFYQENFVIEEIMLDNIKEIKRTFSIMYHSSQLPENWAVWLGIFLVIFVSYKLNENIYFLYLMFISAIITFFVSKIIAHKYKDREYKYMLFDAILVFEKENKFINILPMTSTEYRDVREYFIAKNLGDVLTKKIHWQYKGTIYEKIIIGDKR